MLQVWDGVSDARISFAATDLGLSHRGMAQMTENLNIQRALLRSLSSRPQVELADNVKVMTIQQDSAEAGGWPVVHLSNGRSLRARLLVSLIYAI
jgi:ubiquinone biosynthesis monooxygenase Coq6